MEKYEKIDYQGIDYGLGQSNIDLETGIRYGVIPVSHVPGFWDCAEPVYFYSCPECGHEFGYDYPDVEKCPDCGHEITENDFDFLEPVHWEHIDNDYTLVTDSDCVDIFILNSPYYTYAQFCSPCAPGACYLPSPLSEKTITNKCYCLDKSWFEDEKAPYEYWRL